MPTSKSTTRVLILALAATLLSACDPDSGNQDHMASARDFLETGNSREALIELKNALIEDPRNLEARWELGKLYSRTGNNKGAIKELERARTLGIERDAVLIPLVKAYLGEKDYRRVLLEISTPDFNRPDADAAILYNIQAEAYMGSNNNEQAIEAFANALSRDPSSETARQGLVRASISLGDIERATAYLQELLTAAPESSMAITLKGKLNFLRGQLELASKDYEKALNLDPDNMVAELEMARTLLYLENSEAAKKHIMAVLSRYPGSIDARFLQGWLEFKKGNFPSARTLMEAVVEAAPQHNRARLLLAASSFGMKEYESSAQQLKAYLAREPNNPVGLQLKAALLLQQDQPEKALAVIQAAPPGTIQENPDLLRLAAAATLDSGDSPEAEILLKQAREAAEAKQRKLVKKFAAQADRQLRAGNTGRAAQLLNDIVVSTTGSMAAATRLFDLYLKDKNPVSAQKLASYLSKRYPESAQARIMLGLSYVQLKQPDQARSAFRQALEHDPDSLAAKLNLVGLRRQAGDIDGALADYQALLATNPKDLSIYRELYATETIRGNKDKARIWMKKARAAIPHSWEPYELLAADAIKQGDPSTALAILKNAVSELPDELAPTRALSELQTATGEIEQALSTAADFNNRHPDNADALVLLGNVEAKFGHAAQAQQAFSRALALQANNDGAVIGQFKLQMSANDAKAALSTARIYASNNGAEWLALSLQGEALAALGDYDAAIRSLQKSILEVPSRRSRYKLASALAATNKFNEAEAVLNQLLQQQPDNGKARLMLARLLIMQKKVTEAREQLEQVLSSNPDNAAILNDLAGLYAEDRPQKALQLARDAYARQPGNPAIMDTLGWLLLQQQVNLARAKELLIAAQAGAPNNPTIQYHLAVAMAKSGDTGNAIEELQAILKTDQPVVWRADAQALLDQLNRNNHGSTPLRQPDPPEQTH